MRQKKNFINLLKYEFKIDFRMAGMRYLFCCFIIIFIICLLMHHSYQSGEQVQFWDLYMELWEGIPEYVKGRTSCFKLPVLIMLTQTIILFLIGNIPKQGMKGYGRFEFIYSSRRKWWVSKCMWVFINILLFYMILILMLSLFIIIKEKDIELMHLGTSINYQLIDVSKRVFVLNILLLPIFVSEVLGIIQTFIGVFFKPIFGYVVAESIIVVSAYKVSPLFIGNYQMMMRNRLFSGKSEIDLTRGTIICFVLYTVLFICGSFFIKKEDILALDELDE